MITTDAKCHREIKRRIAIGKEAFSRRRELLRGKLHRNLKIRKNDKDFDMECGAVRVRDMDHEKRRRKKTRSLLNVGMEKNGEN